MLKNQSDEKKVAEENERRELEKRDREEKKAAARAKWSVVQSEIQSAIKEVNEQIASAGLSFAASDGNKAEAAIAQYCIALLPSEKERSVVLNVNAFGSVVPVFLIPHSGQSPTSFKLEDTDVEFWSRLLVDFLDQALAFADGKRSLR